MSRETIEWLNTNTRIGDTDKRGKAWHYRAGSDNHFPGAVPVEEVKELFKPYEPIPQPLFVRVNGQYEQVDNFKGIAPTGNPGLLHAVPGAEYTIHGYQEWLLNNVTNLIDDDVHISSAGLLSNGAVGWVELSISETQTVSDFEYRPHLLASTSVNGKYRTSFGRKVQAVVCDNTLHIASLEQGQSISFKHTKGSTPRIADAREALGLIVATGQEFEKELNELLSTPVSSKDFSRFLDGYVPLVGPDGKELGKAAQTQRENKRETLVKMWRGDDRVAPWSGTAFGVLQLTNTFFHHEKGVKGKTIRAERNLLDAISGETLKSDAETMNILKSVLV
jgi:phage/plasmid-like protein (TIGR03299 family)